MLQNNQANMLARRSNLPYIVAVKWSMPHKSTREPPQKFRQRVGNLIVGGLKVFTDEYSIYNSLKEGLGSIIISHERVNHSGREFARGEVHVNTREKGHSFLGKYRGVSFR